LNQTTALMRNRFLALTLAVLSFVLGAVLPSLSQATLHYADRFKFDHGELKTFRPADYADAKPKSVRLLLSSHR
jgi:hypothetical protein